MTFTENVVRKFDLYSHWYGKEIMTELDHFSWVKVILTARTDTVNATILSEKTSWDLSYLAMCSAAIRKGKKRKERKV